MQLFWWSLSVLALHIYTAEGRLGESGPCERKLAVLDNESDYTIEFGVCRSEDPASECHLKKGSACDQNDCSEIQGVGTITEALTDDTCKGTIEYLLGPDQKNTFTVSLHRENFATVGVFNCAVSYQYTFECPFLSFSFLTCPCTGQVNLDLTVIIVDLNLTVVNNTAELVENDVSEQTSTKFLAMEGDDVNLECSTNAVKLSSSLGMRLGFVFSTLQDPLSTIQEYNKTLSCDTDSSSVVFDPHWVITRKDGNCFLSIKGFGSADNGQYGCHLFLTNSNSQYDSDWSNSVFLISSDELKPSSDFHNSILGLIVTTLFCILVVSMVVIVVAFGIILTGPIVQKCRRPGQRINIEQRRPSYGSISSRSAHDLSRPVSPDPVAHTHGLLVDQVDVADRSYGNSDIESSFNGDIPGHVYNAPSKHEVHDKPLRRVSPAISSSGGDFDPCLSDDDITRINVFARKNTPPSDRPLKYTCPYCHKKYAEDREDYSLYHIHVNCPRKNGASALTAAPESGSSTSSFSDRL